MPFGDRALDAILDAQALRHEAACAAERIARREQQARVLPPGSRDDLAIILECLRRQHRPLADELYPHFAALYAERTGKR